MLTCYFHTVFTRVLFAQVDALLNGLTATPERKKWVDFTYMIWTEPWTMVVPRPGEESRLFAFTKPFQSKVPLNESYKLIRE
jgi:ABC-type amino acid transport substrate-binding protein